MTEEIPSAEPNSPSEKSPSRLHVWRGRMLCAAPVAALIAAIAIANFRFIVLDRADFAVVDADNFMLRAKLIHDALEDGFDLGDFVRIEAHDV